jgi:hypothetical protein
MRALCAEAIGTFALVFAGAVRSSSMPVRRPSVTSASRSSSAS